MKIGLHAPPPGSPTGVADYAEALHAALLRLSNDSTESGEVHLYHLGNNRLHEAIYARAVAEPGVVVLHDAVQHHFMLGTRSRDEYLAEWAYNYGEWNRQLGVELWDERAGSATDPRYFAYPMLRRVAERSRAIIVHNSGAAAIAGAHGAKRIFVIPHYHAPPESTPDLDDTLDFRDRVGIDRSATLFGVFGYLRESKRVLASIQAFRRLHQIRPNTALLLAGEPVSSDLARLLEMEAAYPAIHRLPHLPERDLNIALNTIDCCVNLRYPGAGETSGIAIRAMGAAKPVIATDNPENADFPESTLLRVRIGVAESAELFDHMLLVTDFPGIARSIGRESQFHIQQQHALEPVVQRYWEALCAAAR